MKKSNSRLTLNDFKKSSTNPNQSLLMNFSIGGHQVGKWPQPTKEDDCHPRE